MEYKHIEYMCSYCGMKQVKRINAGKPMPGNCPRKTKTKEGKMRPHTWTVNRKF